MVYEIHWEYCYQWHVIWIVMLKVLITSPFCDSFPDTSFFSSLFLSDRKCPLQKQFPQLLHYAKLVWPKRYVWLLYSTWIRQRRRLRMIPLPMPNNRTAIGTPRRLSVIRNPSELKSDGFRRRMVWSSIVYPFSSVSFLAYYRISV